MEKVFVQEELLLLFVDLAVVVTVVTAIVSFYFGQKVGEAKHDPLIDNDTENGQN